jgi:hypothetical protein
MTRRAPNEPTRNFEPYHRLRDDATLHVLSLGCGECPDFATCGGLHTDAGVFDCNDFCSCADRAACDAVCRNKPDQFFERYLEIGGFDLESTPRVTAGPTPILPSVIPLIDHKYSRRSTLNEPVVAVPLYSSSIGGPASRWSAPVLSLRSDSVYLQPRASSPQVSTATSSLKHGGPSPIET